MNEKPIDSQGHANFPGKIEEYKALRQELMWNTECQIKERNQCVILSAALIGYALANSAPALYLVVWLVVFQYWRQYNTHRSIVVKISRYIAEFLDGTETGLNWSTRVGMAAKHATGTQAITSQKPWLVRGRALLAPHSVLSLASLLLLITKGLPFFVVVPRWSLFVLCISAVSANTALTLSLVGPRWCVLREEWTTVWRHVRREEGELNRVKVSL